MESRLPRKLFTLAEANRTLPLVRRVVQDIMTVYPEWKDLVAQYELIAAQARPDWGESQEQLDLKSRIDAVAGGGDRFLGGRGPNGVAVHAVVAGLLGVYGPPDRAGRPWRGNCSGPSAPWWRLRPSFPPPRDSRGPTPTPAESCPRASWD